MTQLITPRTLKGFRDYPPPLMIPRERLLEQARRVYRSYGFAPIDTPALEYAEILLGKGSDETDRQMYRFQHDRHDVALRFDLTVPFARFAAQHINELGIPFKRYHMGPVWRGENTGHGRFREFWQCDFDLIGTASNAADIEIALVSTGSCAVWGDHELLVTAIRNLIGAKVLGIGSAGLALLQSLGGCAERRCRCQNGECECGAVNHGPSFQVRLWLSLEQISSSTKAHRARQGGGHEALVGI